MFSNIRTITSDNNDKKFAWKQKEKGVALRFQR